MSTESKAKALIVVLLVSSLLFALLATLVTVGVTDAFDASALLWINQHANDAFNSLFVIATELGGIYFVGGLTILLVGYFLIKKRYYGASFITLSVGGIALITMFIKTLFDRPRPDLWEQLVTETSFSFPSGHSSASAALAASIVLLLWNTRWRTVATVAGILYVLIVGVSRMYLGVHFPTDVMGGWLLGITWVALVAGSLYAMKARRVVGAK